MLSREKFEGAGGGNGGRLSLRLRLRLSLILSLIWFPGFAVSFYATAGECKRSWEGGGNG